MGIVNRQPANNSFNPGDSGGGALSSSNALHKLLELGEATGSAAFGTGVFATGSLQKWQGALKDATMSLGGFNSDYANMLNLSKEVYKILPTSADALGKLSSGFQQAGLSTRESNKELREWLVMGTQVQHVMGLNADQTGQWMREMDDLGKSTRDMKSSFNSFYDQLLRNNLTMQDGIRITEDAQKARKSYGGIIGSTQGDLRDSFTGLSAQMKS